MSAKPAKNPMAQAEAIFRRLLAKGNPVAFEEAARAVVTADDVDRRCFGHIPARMHRNGEIVPAGFRESKTGKHNHAIKRLWVLADSKLGRELQRSAI